MNIYPLLRAVLFMFDPERAHAISMTLLEIVYRLKLSRVLFGNRKHAPVKVLGLEFPNAVGLAAGLDKNGSPLSFQIVARHFEEALLCRAGRVWQDAAGWADLRPPLAP